MAAIGDIKVKLDMHSLSEFEDRLARIEEQVGRIVATLDAPGAAARVELAKLVEGHLGEPHRPNDG